MQDDFNSASDEWFALEDGSFPHVSRGGMSGLIAVRARCPLPVRESVDFRAAENVTGAALLILSQSPAARALAKTAIEAGYMLNILPSAGAAAHAVTFGYADPHTRKINASAGDDAARLALRIIHELVHVSQIEKGGLSLDARLGTPAASIRQLLAMEADARARTIQVAIELEFAAPGDPAERLLFPSMVTLAAAEAGVDKTQNLIRDVLPQLPHEVTPGLLLAAAFRSFYSSAGLRRHYEGTVIEAMQTAGDDLRDEKLFTGGRTAAQLGAALDGHMHPAYIARHADIIDLENNFFAAVSQKTQLLLQDLQQKRTVPQEAPWLLPVFDAPSPKPKNQTGPAL